MRKCPICGRVYNEPPALSRADNKTEICSECGLIEALDAAGMEKADQEKVLGIVQKQKKNRG